MTWYLKTCFSLSGAALGCAIFMGAAPALAQTAGVENPTSILILSDDFGYGDSGLYGAGAGRGMPTPASTDWRTKE